MAHPLCLIEGYSLIHPSSRVTRRPRHSFEGSRTRGTSSFVPSQKSLDPLHRPHRTPWLVVFETAQGCLSYPLIGVHRI